MRQVFSFLISKLLTIILNNYLSKIKCNILFAAAQKLRVPSIAQTIVPFGKRANQRPGQRSPEGGQAGGHTAHANFIHTQMTI